MIIALPTLLIGATTNVGKLSKVFEIWQEEGSLFYATCEFDPRTRITLWSGLGNGITFVLYLYGYVQSATQCYSSMPSFLNAHFLLQCLFPCVIAYTSLCYFVGAGVNGI